MIKTRLLSHFCLLFLLSASGISAQETKNQNSKLPQGMTPFDGANKNTLEPTSNFHISQIKHQNAYDGFGYYKLYKNTFNYTLDKFSFTLNAGLLEENTIFNNKAPGFYGSFSATLEYNINKRYSFYLFGRYLTPSLNKGERLNTPEMNLLFPQTEIGAGIRGNFNNVNIDVGTGTIFGTQSSQIPNSLLRSKVSIGF